MWQFPSSTKAGESELASKENGENESTKPQLVFKCYGHIVKFPSVWLVTMYFFHDHFFPEEMKCDTMGCVQNQMVSLISVELSECKVRAGF